MRRSGAIAAVFVLLCASAAYSIDIGVNGRLYSTFFDSYNYGAALRTSGLTSSWTISGTDTHTNLRENTPNAVNQVLSPEILKANPGGYAKVTLGYWSQSAPTSHNPGNGGGPKNPVMQIVQLTAKAGGLDSTVISGVGKAYDGGMYDTDGGLYAFYDRTGVFSGQKGSYFSSTMHGWSPTVQIHYAASGDITTVSSAYRSVIRDTAAAGGRDNDLEILGSKLFVSTENIPSSTIGHDSPGVYYWTRNTTTGQLSAKAFYDDSMGDLQIVSWSKIAAGKAVINGNYYDCVWAIVGNDPYSRSGTMSLAQFIDIDGNGDANGLNEARIVYTNSSSTVTYDDISVEATDLELVYGPQGKNFMLIGDATNQRVTVLQLNADGTFTGTNNSVKVLGVSGLGRDMELDYAVPGDTNGDRLVNGQDIYGFLKALSSASTFYSLNPTVSLIGSSDLNGDGLINGQDIYPFLQALAAPPEAAPEPASMVLLAAGCIGLLRRRK